MVFIFISQSTITCHGGHIEDTWRVYIYIYIYRQQHVLFTQVEAMSSCLTTNLSQANDSTSATFIEKKMSLGDADIVQLFLEILIALFGVVGNALVIFIIVRRGKKKHAGDHFILQLAIADLGTLLIAFPVIIVREKASHNWPFGRFACLYLYPIVEIFYGASVWSIVAIAVERYRKIVSLKSSGLCSRTNSFIRLFATVVSLWVASFVLFCLPLYFVLDYRPVPDGGEWCGLKWPTMFEKIYVGWLTLFSYILPLIIISFTYVVISRVLRQSSSFIKTMKQENVKTEQQGTRLGSLKPSNRLENSSSMTSRKKMNRLSQNKRAKKIITPLVLVFALTMLPLNILRLALTFRPKIVPEDYFSIVLHVVVVTTLLNPAANPVIYSAVSRDFRKEMKSMCHGGRGRQRSSIFSW